MSLGCFFISLYLSGSSPCIQITLFIHLSCSHDTHTFSIDLLSHLIHLPFSSPVCLFARLLHTPYSQIRNPQHHIRIHSLCTCFGETVVDTVTPSPSIYSLYAYLTSESWHAALARFPWPRPQLVYSSDSTRTYWQVMGMWATGNLLLTSFLGSISGVAEATVWS